MSSLHCWCLPASPHLCCCPTQAHLLRQCRSWSHLLGQGAVASLLAEVERLADTATSHLVARRKLWKVLASWEVSTAGGGRGGGRERREAEEGGGGGREEGGSGGRQGREAGQGGRERREDDVVVEVAPVLPSLCMTPAPQPELWLSCTDAQHAPWPCCTSAQQRH